MGRIIQSRGFLKGDDEMRIDIYIKAVLTVIAICLVLIVIKLYPITQAIAGKGEIINVNIEKVGGRSVFKALPVKIESK